MLINPANNLIDKMWDFLKDGGAAERQAERRIV